MLTALGILTVFLVLWALAGMPKSRRIRQGHMVTHDELADDEFMGIGAFPPDDRAFALSIRNGLGRALCVEPATVHPPDTLGYLGRFAFDEGDFSIAMIEVEFDLGVRFPKKFWYPLFEERKFEAVTVRDLIVYLSHNREKLILRKKPRRRKEQ
jgi:hypothetical protein